MAGRQVLSKLIVPDACFIYFGLLHAKAPDASPSKVPKAKARALKAHWGAVSRWSELVTSTFEMSLLTKPCTS